MSLFSFFTKALGAIFGLASHRARRREEESQRREAEERMRREREERMRQLEKERETNKETNKKQEEAQSRVNARRRNKYLFSPSDGTGLWENESKSELGV